MVKTGGEEARQKNYLLWSACQLHCESVQGAPESHLRIRHHFDAFYTLEWKEIGSNDVQVVGVHAFLSLPLTEEGFLF